MYSFKDIWKKLEKEKAPPTRVRNLTEISFRKFKENVKNSKESFVSEITNSLYSGDIFILKEAFDKNFINQLKLKCYSHFQNENPTFHKMLENCPDFHRKIDLETGKKYSFKVCKHSFYFYKWNQDPINIFSEVYERWRVIKILMGLDEMEYENNTPKDGVVDRIQVVRYPSKYGFLEPHSDPYKFQRLFISGYMSKKGKDFNDGGFYALDHNNKIVDVETKIDVGDIGIGYATIVHGVAPANRDKDPDWSDPNDGRWFLSMYSNQSDEVKERHTGYSVTEKININDPLLFPPI